MFHSEYEKRLRSPSKSPSSKLNNSFSYGGNNNSNLYNSPIPLPLSMFHSTYYDDNNNNNSNSEINISNNNSPNKKTTTTTTTTTTSNINGTPISSNDSYGDRFIPLSINVESQNNYSIQESDYQYCYPSENSSISFDRQKEESHLAYNIVLKNELLGSSSLYSSFLDSPTSPSSIFKQQQYINVNNNNNNNNSPINNSPINNNGQLNNNVNSNNINNNHNINNNNNNNEMNEIINQSPSKKKFSNGNGLLLKYNGGFKNGNINGSGNGSSNSSGNTSLNSGSGKSNKSIDYNSDSSSPYSLSPLSDVSQKLLSSPRKPQRKISKTPIKILDAPGIKDDFYLNLIDWSSSNVLAVGLDSSVYLWNATTSQVSKLCEMESGQTVSSVGWIQRGGTHLAIGGTDGIVSIWDVTKKKKIRELQGHSSRVNALAWNNHILSSGGKDKTILCHDVRDSSSSYSNRLVGHRHEICGLKWSPDGQQLASGGNDNLLNIWDISNCNNGSLGGNSNDNITKPLYQFKFHYAAVKAIAWSPHCRGLLSSGGGTHDKCIRFWNTTTGQHIQTVDTGSQVCNLAWSKNVNELVSTHGFSQNQITVWNYPTMQPVTTLTGHTMRVLYLAVSPDGQTICTGAGDKSLRFWNLFPASKESTFSSSLDSFYNKKGLDIR